MNGSSVAMAFPCSWEQRGIPGVHELLGSLPCVQRIQYIGPSGHALIVSILTVHLPMSLRE